MKCDICNETITNLEEKDFHVIIGKSGDIPFDVSKFEFFMCRKCKRRMNVCLSDERLSDEYLTRPLTLLFKRIINDEKERWKPEESTERTSVMYPDDDHEDYSGELQITKGNDGDLHVITTGEKAVRLCRSGGASSLIPGVTTLLDRIFNKIAKYMDEKERRKSG